MEGCAKPTLGNTSALSADTNAKPAADSPDIDTSSTEPVGTFNKSNLGAVLSCSPLVFVSYHSGKNESAYGRSNTSRSTSNDKVVASISSDDK